MPLRAYLLAVQNREAPLRLASEHVSVRFGNVLALHDLSLTLEFGDRLLICGPAASGKTTLLKCLAGLCRPTSGRVLWGTEDVATLSISERRTRQRAFGMIFQSDALFDSKTAAENVCLPLERRGVPIQQARSRAEEALTRVGLQHAFNVRPEELSGGMKKRVGVARAIVARPEVLLADDPFAGLDPQSAKSIADLLLEVSNDRTLVVAIPDPLSILPIDRVVTLHEGALQFAPSHEGHRATLGVGL